MYQWVKNRRKCVKKSLFRENNQFYTKNQSCGKKDHQVLRILKCIFGIRFCFLPIWEKFNLPFDYFEFNLVTVRIFPPPYAESNPTSLSKQHFHRSKQTSSIQYSSRFFGIRDPIRPLFICVGSESPTSKIHM
jgi:hypothetical protein